jgi:hypothetical protein
MKSWPDAHRRTRSGCRSRAAPRSRPNWSRSGQSGEQSLKRIESAGERASGGLKGLGRQTDLLRTGIRTLGGALIGAATVGGLGALIDRSICAANEVGKTADKIGVSVEALQELRFAAKAPGIEQQTLDMAPQRFTRRAADPFGCLRPWNGLRALMESAPPATPPRPAPAWSPC